MKKLTSLLIAFFCFTAIKLTAQELPNLNERIYTLSFLWKEMEYTFAFPEKNKAANLDSLYFAYMPKVSQVKDDYEYFRVLSEFMAHFNEAHTRIVKSNRPDDRPPIESTVVGNKVVVTNISKSNVKEIPIGSEIIKVNGIPVMEYLKDSVYPYISASTQRWKFVKSVSEMFYGRPNSVVGITVKTPKGKENDIELVRNFYTNGTGIIMESASEETSFDVKIIDKNIGYIKFKSCLRQYLDTINIVLNQNMPKLQKCKGLILDIRGNRGGTDETWNVLAFHLMSGKEFQNKGKWFSRMHIPVYKNMGKDVPQLKEFYLGTAMHEIKYPPYQNPIADSLKLTQPLVVISGDFVGSAAEDFLTVLKENDRGTIIGGATVGCIGEPMFFSLPGDYTAMICAKKYVNSDDTQPNDTGILPDMEIEANYEYYLKGKDNILEYALKYLIAP